MPSDNQVVACGGASGAGVIIGAFVGLGMGIWACVKYVEPAFEKTHGINGKGAKALTALVALAGGLEATTGAGAVAGLIAVSMLACCFCCCAGSTNNTSRLSSNRSTMYATPTRAVEIARTDAVVLTI